VLTFHKILAGCEQGSREPWQRFLCDYTPGAFALLNVYAPRFSVEQRDESWRRMVQALAENNFQRLRELDHQSERVFLTDLRRLLLQRILATLDPRLDSQTPSPTAEALNSLLKGQPLLHQMICFLKLAGYSDSTLEGLLRIPPSVAHQGLDRLGTDFSASLRRQKDECRWPSAWVNLLQQAWTSGTEQCSPVRQFVRILDGQIGWYDKVPIERHVAGCLHCLEGWSALREIAYWKREAKPLPTQETDSFLRGLPIAAQSKLQKPFLKRVFG